MSRLPSMWNPKTISLASDEFRTPVISLFDSLMTDMFKSMDPFGSLTESVKSRSYPKVDVRQSDKDLVFEAVVPFVKQEDLDVTIKDGILQISGKVQKDETIEDSSFVKRELVRSSFTRSFPLNDGMYSDWEKQGGEVTADLSEGILTIKLINFFEVARGDPETSNVRKIAIK